MEKFDITVLIAYAESIENMQMLHSFVRLCNDWAATIMDKIKQCGTDKLNTYLLNRKLSEINKLCKQVKQKFVGGRIQQNVVYDKNIPPVGKPSAIQQNVTSDGGASRSADPTLHDDQQASRSTRPTNVTSDGSRSVGRIIHDDQQPSCSGIQTSRTVGRTSRIDQQPSTSACRSPRSVAPVSHRPISRSEEPHVAFVDIERAFRSKITTGFVRNHGFRDLNTFLVAATNLIRGRIMEALVAHGAIKVYTSLLAEFETIHSTDTRHITTESLSLFPVDDVAEWYEYVCNSLKATLDEFQDRDSGWRMTRLDGLYLHIQSFVPLNASCNVSVPPFLVAKRAVRNVKSNDNQCFKYAVLAALNKDKINEMHNPSKPFQYDKYVRDVVWSGLTFPVALTDINKFEKNNPDISVNVYTFNEEETTVVPLRLTKADKKKHIDLLFLHTEQCNHYCAITDLSALVRAQMTRHKKRIHICNRCMHGFYTANKLAEHRINCKNQNNCVRVIMPERERSVLQFKHFRRKEPAPFIIYADFESIIKPTTSLIHKQAYAEHIPFSAGYYLHCRYDSQLSEYKQYRESDSATSDPAKWLVDELIAIGHKYCNVFTTVKPMIISEEEEKQFNASTTCHICEKTILSSQTKVHDHCHITGKFRGAAHDTCNLQYQIQNFIPIVFHNMSGYDIHFLMIELSKRNGQLSVLPETKEKYISVSLKLPTANLIELRFIDSLKFLNSGLDKLASFLDISDVKILRSQFPNLNDAKFNLLTKKGVFPYEYIDCIEKLDEIALPEKAKFYSSLNDADISDDDYARAQVVWEKFKIKTLGDYSDLYLKTDVLLLADVFEKFRDTSLKDYTLDPAYYYTLPGYTWDAALKFTKQKLELLTDIDMLLFVERGVRGGLTQCSSRYATANNKYMSDYDDTQPSTYLMYWDVNNLYGWAMCQPLPYGNFKWETVTQDFNVFDIPDDSDRGYFLEVDLEYPEEIHDLHSDLPFCPEQRCPPGKKDAKLLATLYNKYKYVTHYRNLKQCLNNGMRLKKIHKILSFSQSPWLASYIRKNTELRIQSKNDFEKNLYKLMNNAVFGKTMENVRNHRNVRLCTQWETRFQAKACIAKPNFHSIAIFNENFVAIQLKKQEVKMIKPVYIGMAILDISKTRVYDFHYNFMLPTLKDKCKLLYTDTDSLIYEVTDHDAYKLMGEYNELFDTSAFPENNVFGLRRLNKKIPGLWSEENEGRIMIVFIGLRPKMYCIKMADGDIVKKAKGVKQCVVANNILFDHFYVTLKNDIVITCEQNSIRSKLHNVYTVCEEKVALSADDDKRYIIHGSTNTLPWGHYSLNKRNLELDASDEILVDTLASMYNSQNPIDQCNRRHSVELDASDELLVDTLVSMMDDYEVPCKRLKVNEFVAELEKMS